MCFENIYPHIVCVCKTKDEKQDSVEIMGTGLFLDVNGKRYLLTAGHVMDVPRGILVMGDNGKPIVAPLREGWITSGEDMTHYDLGLIELGDEYKVNEKTAYPFIQLLGDKELIAGEDAVMICGFPVAMATVKDYGKRAIESIAVNYSEKESYVNYSVYDPFNGDAHLAVEWNANTIQGPHGTARLNSGPAGLKGLSGAPMWVVKQAIPSLVGIVTSHYALRGKEYIIGVRKHLVIHFVKCCLGI